MKMRYVVMESFEGHTHVCGVYKSRDLAKAFADAMQGGSVFYEVREQPYYRSIGDVAKEVERATSGRRTVKKDQAAAG